ncbi:MAG TPA: hypothetical protein VGQ42_01295 [Candidatus Dormibacteraeota bacterium]|nr:hypothetical protein [Candidatus Dormibacteraeota bacterium]
MTEDIAAKPVDVVAVVAEIEAEVAARRAAGEYPEELLQRLAVEFHDVADERTSLEELAHIETVRPLLSTRRGLGSAVVFAKKALRRAMAWYVRPIAEDQSRFNFTLLHELRELRERVERLDSAWVRPAGSPPREAGAASLGLTEARLAHLDAPLRDLPPGPVLVLWWADDALLAGLVARGLTVEVATRDAAMAGAARACGVRVHDSDPMRLLHESGPTLAAVLAPGLLPMLAPTEMLELVPLAAAALRERGLVMFDAPDSAGPGVPADPALIDPGYRRWVARDTVTLLCEAAGLRDIAVDTLDTALWFAVTARRQA